MTKFLIICIIALTYIPKIYGFNWEKCKEKVMKGTDVTGGAGLLSTTQFSSSWGPCSSLAKNETGKRQQYVYLNREQLQTEIAQGRGEFLDAYLNLHCLTQKEASFAANTLQQNYQRIFKNDSSSNDLFHVLESEMRTVSHCLFKEPQT